MTGRGRRRDDVPVTFFSFQDVMMCMIGITIITTLILILQVGRIAVGRAEGESDQVVSAAATEVGNLEEDLQSLEEERRRYLDAHIVNAEVILADSIADIERLQEDENRLAELVEEEQRRLKRLRDRAASNPALLEALELTDSLAKLRAKREEVEARKRITYLVSTADVLRPLIVELSSNSMVVSADRSSESPIRLVVQDAQSAARQLVQYFKSQGVSRGRYLLLVVKPSGLPLYHYVKGLMGAEYAKLPKGDPRARQFTVGVDFVPEDSHTNDIFPSWSGDKQ